METSAEFPPTVTVQSRIRHYLHFILLRGIENVLSNYFPTNLVTVKSSMWMLHFHMPVMSPQNQNQKQEEKSRKDLRFPKVFRVWK